MIDGFLALFFQRCWHIVGEEVSKYIVGVLNGNTDLTLMNITNIVLIPKVQYPTNMANFRPISLCNVIYKIIAKVITNRFQRLLNGCINVSQSVFVPGRLITDNVLLGYELLHTFNQKRKRKKCGMALKLDMSKAYNRVE